MKLPAISVLGNYCTIWRCVTLQVQIRMIVYIIRRRVWLCPYRTEIYACSPFGLSWGQTTFMRKCISTFLPFFWASDLKPPIVIKRAQQQNRTRTRSTAITVSLTLKEAGQSSVAHTQVRRTVAYLATETSTT
jgi:hypothetical protein